MFNVIKKEMNSDIVYLKELKETLEKDDFQRVTVVFFDKENVDKAKILIKKYNKSHHIQETDSYYKINIYGWFRFWKSNLWTLPW